MRKFCIAKELSPKGMNQTFAIFFQTHPKSRQNPLREIIFVLHQKHTWIFCCNSQAFPDFFLVFSGLEKSIFLRFFYDEKIDFLREKIRNTGISSETMIPGISSETTIPGISSEPTAAPVSTW